jgi:hypothetical protein
LAESHIGQANACAIQQRSEYCTEVLVLSTDAPPVKRTAWATLAHDGSIAEDVSQ